MLQVFISTVLVDNTIKFCLSGILSQRCRILFRMIVAEQSKAVAVVKALCVLHNYLRTVGDANYTPPGFTDVAAENGVVQEGFWRTSNVNLQPARLANRSVSNDGTTIRQHLCAYFTGNGSVPWQLDIINRR